MSKIHGNGVITTSRYMAPSLNIDDHASNMTVKRAQAIGRDAGNRNMLRACRTAWNQEDELAATSAFLKAMEFVR